MRKSTPTLAPSYPIPLHTILHSPIPQSRAHCILGEYQWVGRLPNQGTLKNELSLRTKRDLFSIIHFLPNTLLCFLHQPFSAWRFAEHISAAGTGNKRQVIDWGWDFYHCNQILIILLCAYNTIHSGTCSIRSCVAKSHLPEGVCVTISIFSTICNELKPLREPGNPQVFQQLRKHSEAAFFCKDGNRLSFINTVVFLLLMLTSLFQASWH